ncbi:MAG: carbon-nitrogen hydrolase family protein [Spirochaetes bacterium]|nr:carbon-nitrogen hydrolase family protein [Spirochaetota bacterium]
MKKIRLALIQKKPGTSVTKEIINKLKLFKPHFVCFPEYFFVNKKSDHLSQTAHNYRRQLKKIEFISGILNCLVIGGTLPEPEGDNIYNTSHVYFKGARLGSYRKQNLFRREHGRINPGNELKIFSAYGIKFGVLICADVFIEEYFIKMNEMGAQIIFVPTFSPRKDESAEEKFKRDNDIFVKAAKTADAVIVKVCGVKSEFRDFLQARSLIADKNGIIFRVMPDEEDSEMIITKEIEI